MKRLTRIPLLIVALLGAGCGEPTLDGAAPFPELAETPVPSQETRAQGPERQAVPLAGGLAAGFSAGWRAFAEDGVTVLVHDMEGGRPDALVYTEVFSDLSERLPSQEARRFALTVDPALIRSRFWASPEREKDRWAAEIARTRGRGIGYASIAGSFSGWRWIGPNQRGVWLRLARTRGTWGEPPLEGGTAPATTVAATMVLGSASWREGGAHLALLCVREPVCVPARDLAHLLDSVHPLTKAAAGEALPLSDLEIELGIAVSPRAEILEPAAL